MIYGEGVKEVPEERKIGGDRCLMFSRSESRLDAWKGFSSGHNRPSRLAARLS